MNEFLSVATLAKVISSFGGALFSVSIIKPKNRGDLLRRAFGGTLCGLISGGLVMNYFEWEKLELIVTAYGMTACFGYFVFSAILTTLSRFQDVQSAVREFKEMRQSLDKEHKK